MTFYYYLLQFQNNKKGSLGTLSVMFKNLYLSFLEVLHG